MEEKMLYCYLEYQKESNPSIWKKLMKFPKTLWLSLFGVTVCLILAFIMIMVFGKYYISTLISTTGMFFCLLSHYLLDRFLVNNSDNAMDKHKKYCEELANWLKKYNFKTDGAIKLLYNRLNSTINEMISEHKEQDERFDKRVQTVVIPVILSIITTIIAKQDDILMMLSIIFSLVFVFEVIYCVVLFFRSITRLPNKHRLEQMRYFADDLQDVLDIHSIEEPLD